MPDSDKSLDILIRFITDTQGAEAAKEAIAQVKAAARKAGEEGGRAAEEPKSGEASGKTRQTAGESRDANRNGGEPTRESQAGTATTAGGSGGEKSGDTNLNVPDSLFKPDARIADILQAAAEAKAASDRELVAALQNILSAEQELQRAIAELRNFNTNGR